MFIKELYYKWRTMFWVVIVFIIFQAFFMYKAVETVPFFLYNMYSTRQQPYDTSYRTKIFINGKEYNADRLTGREKETLMGSLFYFLKLRKSGFHATDTQTINKRFKGKVSKDLYNLFYKRLTNTSVNDSLFFNWWAKYLSRVSGQNVDSISIIKSSWVWTPHFRPLKDTVSMFNYVSGK